MGAAMAYVGKLWRGDERLVVTYWVFGTVMLWALTAIGARFVEALSRVAEASMGGLVAVLAYYLATLLYVAFVWTAIWRSASRYDGWRCWAVLAKLVVVVGALAMATGIAVSVTGFGTA